MKRVICLLISICCFILALEAQTKSTLKTIDQQLSGDIYLAEGKVDFKGDKGPINWEERFRIRSVQLLKSDLIINIELSKFRPLEKELELDFELEMKTNAGRTLYPAAYVISGNQKATYSNKNQNLRLVWNNWIDDFIPVSNGADLYLRGLIVGSQPVNCNKNPQFGATQKWPHYIMAGVGVGLFISSFPVEDDAETLNEEYISQVFEGDEEAATTYSRANNQNKTANFLKNAGIIIVAADVVLYGILSIIFKSKKRSFDFYCGENKNLEIEPVITFGNPLNSNLGLQMSYTF